MSSTLQRRDKWIPWYFVFFFIALALVDGIMVTLAMRTQTGTVTEHAYEKGLAYNRVIAAEAQQQALGWKGEITYANGRLRFTLRDKNQTPITLEKASATLTRPTQAGMDFTVTLEGDEAVVNFPAKGLWEVRINATARGEAYQQSKRIVVK